MNRSSTLVAFAALAAVVALGLGLDLIAPDPQDQPQPLVIGSAAVAGASYCAVGDTEDGRELTVIAAVPAAETPAEVRWATQREGAASRTEELLVAPSTSFTRHVAPDLPDVGVVARWWHTPAAVSRLWVVDTPGAPRGFVEGPCEPRPSEEWVIPGMATAGGAQAWVMISNPFGSDASVEITLTTPAGLERPLRLENVAIPERSVRSIALNEHFADAANVGVIVQTRAGRVVVEGYQTFSAAIGGIDGVSLSKAAAAPATQWTIPWFPDGDNVQSWLWASNPTEQTAALSITLHTTTGSLPPQDVGEVLLDPFTVQRIDLRELLPDGPGRGGVTVLSDNDVPFVASVATLFESTSGTETGVAVQLGATAPDARWVLSGSSVAGRAEFLHMVNPTGQDAVIDVIIWTPDGPLIPSDLFGLVIPPGAIIAVDIAAQIPPEAADHTLFVNASQGSVVAGRQAFDTFGTLQLVAGIGVPSSVWAGGQEVAAVEFEPELLR